jgi:hypothetical protein
MDRGYLDFERLYALNQAPAFFITRSKSNTKVRRRGTGTFYIPPVKSFFKCHYFR